MRGSERRPYSGLWRVGAAVVALALSTAGCDEPKPKAKPKATASPTPAATMSESPVVNAEPPVKRRDPSECKKDGPITFSNKALEKEVRRKLGKESGDIKPGDLSGVKSLNLTQAKLDELDPCVFPFLRKMTGLYLGPGRIEDLGLLKHAVSLTSLRASMNPIKKLEGLEGLTKLDRVDLGHTKVTDLKPLAKLVNITDLQLDDTPVSDLSPLKGLAKLERLSVQRTQVKDLSPLKGLKQLKFVYIKDAPVDDAFALTQPGLKVVDQ